MLAISQQKYPSRGTLLIATFLSLVRHCEPMSARRLTEPSSLFSRNFPDSKRQDLGSPNDLSRHMMDSQTEMQPNADSAAFHRSVFIAPALPSCADGYEADAMGRCVKNVNIDHEVHFTFLLQRLNNRFANRGSPEALYNKRKVPNEPLQLNVPLVLATDINSFRVDYKEMKESIEIPIGIAPREYGSPQE